MYILNSFFKKQFRLPLFSFDIHSHLLPAVDDGSGSMEETLNILSGLKEKGVKAIFFTPHIMAGYPKNDSTYLKNQFRLFMEKYKMFQEEEYPKVRLTAEYMLDEDFERHLKQGLLTYDGRHVLVEMSCVQRPMDMDDKLYEMQLAGYVPILAHAERYQFLPDKEYEKLKGKGCRLQLNLFSLHGFYGPEVKQCAELLLKKGLYDFVGSDIHSWNYLRLYSSAFLSKKQVGRIISLLENNRLLSKSSDMTDINSIY